MWCIRILYKNILTNRKFAVNELKNEKEIIINRIKASEKNIISVVYEMFPSIISVKE